MKPTSITANCGKKELAVLWDDGHASLYTFSSLRADCPHLHLRQVQVCAECRGKHDKMGDTPDPSVFTAVPPDSPATRINNVLPVGSYGITPIWEYWHAVGIYRWEYLRALCRCVECRN